MIEQKMERERVLQMPAGFKYKDVFLKGRPVHDKYSRFYAKHPPMPPSRWAKIYSPFDALKGFREAIGSMEQNIMSDIDDETYLPQD